MSRRDEQQRASDITLVEWAMVEPHTLVARRDTDLEQWQSFLNANTHDTTEMRFFRLEITTHCPHQ